MYIYFILMCVLYSKVYTYLQYYQGIILYIRRFLRLYVHIIALLIHIIIRNVRIGILYYCTIYIHISVIILLQEDVTHTYVSPLSCIRTELKIYVHQSIVYCQYLVLISLSELIYYKTLR